MTNLNCKNCNRKIQENFCSFCGQKTKVGKINFVNFLNEVSESVFQIDKGFFYTLKELFVRPGHSIREYLEGKRKNHFKPIAYAITISTVYFLITQFGGGETILDNAVKGYENAMNDNELQSNKLLVFKWFAKNYAYTTLLLIPLYSFASYLAFRRFGYNYLEHLILNAYIVGQQAIFYSIFALFSINVTTEKNKDIFVSIAVLFSIIYAFYVFWQFFHKSKRISIVFRSILTYVLYYFLFLLPIAIISNYLAM